MGFGFSTNVATGSSRLCSGLSTRAEDRQRNEEVERCLQNKTFKMSYFFFSFRLNNCSLLRFQSSVAPEYRSSEFYTRQHDLEFKVLHLLNYNFFGIGIVLWGFSSGNMNEKKINFLITLTKSDVHVESVHRPFWGFFFLKNKSLVLHSSS